MSIIIKKTGTGILLIYLKIVDKAKEAERIEE